MKIAPTIILDVDTNKQHEGIIIYVNSENISCPMTYLEMEFLLYLLKTTNVDSISSDLFMIDNTTGFEYVEKPTKDNLDINQEAPPNDTTVTYATPKDGSTIPNI